MKERIAIISGASSGIGRSAALQLARKGVRLILNARDQVKLSMLENEINSLSGQPLASSVCGSVTNESLIGACIEKCRENWGAVPDILIASAGRGLPGTVITSDSGEWDDLINVNIKGLMFQLKEMAKTMLAEMEKGRDFVSAPMDIIVIGSSVGRNVSPFNSVYGATKFAVHGLTEALRRQLSTSGIRVSLIEPGLVSTNFQQAAGYDRTWFEGYAKEVGPILLADDVANIITFLLSLPGNVNLDNISIRPTRQSYP